MVMEILTLMGNLPRTGCVTVSQTWKKKFCKSIGIFIINATEILQKVKISHENNIFLVKLSCKFAIFGKFTMQMTYFWKIYHGNKEFLENLPCN
jgi:hypothetical protein